MIIPDENGTEEMAGGLVKGTKACHVADDSG
jgi:hypothetical protein